jgi:hypothetical protein
VGTVVATQLAALVLANQVGMLAGQVVTQVVVLHKLLPTMTTFKAAHRLVLQNKRELFQKITMRYFSVFLLA